MYKQLLEKCAAVSAALIAVSKTKPISAIKSLYDEGQRDFGENRVQELVEKEEALPKDIKWHLIGHLQKNKVKYIAPFVHLIHSVDSIALLKTINKEAKKNNRIISILLQIKIAAEDTKYGLSPSEVTELLHHVSSNKESFAHVNIIGLMGMATFINDEEQVRNEFKSLTLLRDKLQSELLNITLPEISMGMSGDYEIALSEGSTMIRVWKLTLW